MGGSCSFVFSLFGWLLSYSLSVLITRTHVRWCLHLLFFSNWWEWDKDNKGGNRVATAAVVHTRVTFDGFLFAILVCHLAVSLSSSMAFFFFCFYLRPSEVAIASLLIVDGLLSWRDFDLLSIPSHRRHTYYSAHGSRAAGTLKLYRFFFSFPSRA